MKKIIKKMTPIPIYNFFFHFYIEGQVDSRPTSAELKNDLAFCTRLVSLFMTVCPHSTSFSKIASNDSLPYGSAAEQGATGTALWIFKNTNPAVSNAVASPIQEKQLKW